MNLTEIRNEDGTLPAYAWPGGYQMFYICQDSGILCPDCANENAALSGDRDDPQWNVTAYGINYEDQEFVCDNCNKLIPAAYGD